ncbi:MAG: glycosyltransferase [Bacteroidetes bacterium]|nr:glycosyltransferase [Bacteroidota bacterium]MBU2585522.1 glycosyltransferase [Bacteroidota bacterium]
MISIIIPSLNEEKLLPNLLEQLNSEELKSKFNYEIILSDGGSKDKTIEKALKFCDKIVTNTNGTRQTISQGKNAGAKHSIGATLIFLCADCLIEKPHDFFSFVTNEFNHSEYKAATFRFEIAPSEKRLSDILFHMFYNSYVRFLNYIGIGMGRGECQVIKREVFEKYNGYDETLTAGEDWDLYKKIRKNGKIKVKFDLKIYESPRRYRKFGYHRVFWLWLLNALNVMKIIPKPVDEWVEVR